MYEVRVAMHRSEEEAQYLRDGFRPTALAPVQIAQPGLLSGKVEVKVQAMILLIKEVVEEA